MNKKMFTKLFALVLAVCAVLSLAVIVSSAAEESATITFNNKSKRTEYSTTKQVWEENGITVTNDKGSSTSNVGDYYNPARFYKSSKLTIKAPGAISKIVVNANNTSYATAMKNSVKTTEGTVTVSSKAVTIVPANTASDTFTVASLSGGQVRIDSIAVYYTVDAGDPECQHTNTTAVEEKPATCTKTGTTAGTVCDDCGAVIDGCEVIPATGHGELTHVETKDATCIAKGSKTENCTVCGEDIVTTISYADHNIVDGVCSVCNVVETPKAGVAYNFGMFQSNLSKIYYITGSMSSYYMATSTTASSGVYVYLEETDGGYHMYTFINGNKQYMNMVVSRTYVNAKFEAKASSVYTYDAKNYAVVTKVNNTNYYFGNYGTYNNVGTAKYTTDHICRFYAAPNAPEFKEASVKLGTDLSMLYTVSVPTGTPSMTFKFNGETVTVSEYTTNEDGTYTFEFAGIAPQQMSLNISAIINVNNKAVVGFDNYSVEKNLNNIKNAEGASEELVALVNSVLIYGNASENYIGNTAGVDATDLKNDVAENDATFTLDNAETFGFTAAGVNFDAANKIYVKFFVEGEFTLTVNGVAVEVEATEDGNYKVYTNALTAKQFADTYEFVIEANGEKAVLTYSVNAYAKAMQNNAAMSELAAALYAYGVNAKAYVA